MLEIEIKARWEDSEEKILKLGAKFLSEEKQEDVYLNHPVRDFRETDEALRIRNSNGNLSLVYKGPRMDKETKTREEFKSPASEETIEILERLGFKQAAVVRKTRRNFTLDGIGISLDEVDGLGSFIEVETDKDENKAKLFQLLERLGIPKEKTIVKSYLELLQETIVKSYLELLQDESH